MTEREKELVKAMFSPCWNTNGGENWNKNNMYLFNVLNPEKIYDSKRLVCYDENARKNIDALEAALEQLKAYRIALAERYNDLYSAIPDPVIELERRVNYYDHNKVTFCLQSYDLIDGNKANFNTIGTYTGAERRKAITDYKAYIKSHPGIKAETNVKSI